MRFDVNVSVRPAGSDELRTRTELKNMNSFNFAAKGIEKRGRAADQDLRVRRHGRAGDAPLRPGQRGLAAASLQGGGAGLPLLPRARPRPGAPAGRAGRGAARRRSASSRRADQPDRRDALVLRRRRARHRRARPALVGGRRRGRRPEGDRERARERVRRDRGRPRARERGRAREARRRRAPRSRARRSTRRSRTSGDDGFSADPYLAQKAVSDVGELDPVIDAVIAANPAQAEQYRGGKEGLLGFFVGQVMKETGGKADPRVVSERRAREADGLDRASPEVAWRSATCSRPGRRRCPPEVLAAEAEPMVHHRGADFRERLRAHARTAPGGVPHARRRCCSSRRPARARWSPPSRT